MSGSTALSPISTRTHAALLRISSSLSRSALLYRSTLTLLCIFPTWSNPFIYPSFGILVSFGFISMALSKHSNDSSYLPNFPRASPLPAQAPAHSPAITPRATTGRSGHRPQQAWKMALRSFGPAATTSTLYQASTSRRPRFRISGATISSAIAGQRWRRYRKTVG